MRCRVRGWYGRREEKAGNPVVIGLFPYPLFTHKAGRAQGFPRRRSRSISMLIKRNNPCLGFLPVLKK